MWKESNRKPNKIWVDKGSECFNRSMKSCLEKNDIKMYSTHSERNSVVAERLISTLKNKIYEYIYKYITNKIKFSVSKNVYIDKLDDIVNKHNNTYHKIIKMKSVDVESSTKIDSNKEVNNEDPKFKIASNVRISKYKNIFGKGYVPNWSEDVFVIKKTKNTVPWTYVISDLKDEGIVATFYEKGLQKTNQKEFRVEK